MSDKKWKGKSTYQMRLALQNASRMAQAKRVVVEQLDKGIKDEENKAKEEIVRLIGPAYELDWQDLALGYWECSGSPTGHCIYDTAEDPMKDECLFCGDPSERK